MKRKTKTATLNMRTAPAVREMAAKLAAADQRSIAVTIERLIAAAYAKLEKGKAA
jgi:hypothetical protein